MSKPTEIWAPVKTWERRYEVSTLGHVRDIHKKSGPQLVPLTLMQDGTVSVYLHHNSRRRWPRVHVLMAEAFLANPDGLPCVEHLNDIRSDNRLENLRWSYWLKQQSADTENLSQYKPVPSVEGLMVSREGQFIYRGRKKAVTGNKQVNGQPASLRINIRRDNRTTSYQAARLVAETWLWRYSPDCYITYRDGDCHNIKADNLQIADEEDYNDYLRRNSGYEAATVEERRRKLQLVIDEATMTKHYLETLDLQPIHRHVEEYLYPTLVAWSIKTLQFGEYKSVELAADAIARMYETITAGMCLYNYERYLKKLMHNYKRTGSFGYTGNVPKPIQIIVEQLNLDCLWERYKVKHFKR